MPNDTPDMPIPEQLGICPDCGYYPLDELSNLQAENLALQLKLDEATRPINRDVVKAFMAIDRAMYPTIIDTVNAILENRRMNSNPPADQPKEKP